MLAFPQYRDLSRELQWRFTAPDECDSLYENCSIINATTLKISPGLD